MALTLLVFYNRHQRKLYAKERAVQEMQLAHQRALLENNILVQEQERRRIARDLHDEIGNKLNITRLNIAQIRPDNATQWPNLIGDAKQLIDAAIDASRRISHNLLPPVLQEFGLEKALAELCRELSTADSLKATCDMRNKVNERLDKQTELGVFRIVQELVNNTLKHARANSITVQLELLADRLHLQYADDGVGFDLEKARKSNGLGLQNLESRAAMIHGKLEIDSAPGQGFRASLTIKNPTYASH